MGRGSHESLSLPEPGEGRRRPAQPDRGSSPGRQGRRDERDLVLCRRQATLVRVGDRDDEGVHLSVEDASKVRTPVPIPDKSYIYHECSLPVRSEVAPERFLHAFWGVSSCAVKHNKCCLSRISGRATGCPGELGGGSAMLIASAIAPEDHQGERRAGGRALAPRRAGAEDDLRPLLAGGV